MSELEFYKKLKAAHTDLNSEDPNTQAAQTAMQKLEKIVFSHRDLVLNGNAEKIAELMQDTRPQYSAREVRLEEAIRAEIIEGNLSPQEALLRFSKYPPIQRTFNYSALEAAAMGLKPDTAFVHVGCGSLPETVIGIQKQTGNRNLKGIDMDKEAIDKGNALLCALDLSQINLTHANGAEFDYKDSSAILVAVLVRPEVETVARICETAKKDTPVTVALRRSFGAAQAIYEDVSQKSLHTLKQNGFTQIDRVTGHAVVQTDIYRRN